MPVIVLWGTGKIGQKLLDSLEKNSNSFDIAAVVDSAAKKQGTIWNGYEIKSPEVIKSIQFDKIITSPSIYSQVYRQLANDFGPKFLSHLDNCYFLLRENVLNYYRGEEEPEKEECIDFIKSHPINVFNYEFARRYVDLKIDVHLDENNGLYYVYYKSKRMYLNRHYDSVTKVERYVRHILSEQDAESPHRYLDQQFIIEKDCVLLDGGAAEGNFALEIIELVKKIYLVESDKLWIEALKYTFAPFRDKVILVHGFLSDKSSKECITIDEIMKGNSLDYIKMDIEGAELPALAGGKSTLSSNNIQLAICSYHRENDFDNIKALLCSYGYECTNKKGYMAYITSDNFTDLKLPKLVRGILYGKKS